MSKVLEDFKIVKFKTINAGYDYGYKVWDEIEQALQRLEEIDSVNPSEALECFKDIEKRCKNDYEYCIDCYDYEKELSTINKALLKAQEMEEETYVIYCVNNFHNIYMDYGGEPCNYEVATIFNNKFEAHKFLREKGTDNYYIWSVFNVKDLEESQKWRIE